MHQLFRNPLVPLSFFLAILLGTFLYSLTLLPALDYPITTNSDTSILNFNGEEIRVTLAVSPSARTKGLSGRLGLAEGTGMLFIFERAGNHGIWMKEMNFPIDILWLDEELRVVHIKERAEPSSYPETFRPSLPARYVLEVPAGFVKEKTVILGSQFSVVH